MALFDSLIKPALDSVNDLIGQFHLSPEDKLKAETAMQAAQAAAQANALEYEEKLNDIAGQNIRAETGSTDKFTSRARPAFLYMIIAIMGFNYMVLPFAQIFGSRIGPMILPPDLLSLFGIGFTGYIVRDHLSEVLQSKGDSSISFLGYKASQKN